MKQPWTIEIRPDQDGGCFVSVVELPGCMTEGDTLQEGIEMIQDALALWLTVSLEHGDPIPEPRVIDDYSGKVFVRTSKQLHRLVSEEAARQGVSMSQWVGEVLAREVGLKAGGRTAG